MIRTLAPLLALLLATGCGTAQPGDLPQFTFGRTGMGPGEFNYPRAAAIAPTGELYVVDKAGRFQAFTQDGEFLREWRMPQIDAGKPTGFGVAPDGRLFVADTHYSRVIIFDPEGRELQRFGGFGEGPGQFRLPTDIGVSSDGHVFVAEYGGNDRISRFTPQLEYEFSFGDRNAGVASLRRPQCVTIDRDDTLWVADAGHHRICHFGADGVLLGAFGAMGQAVGELSFPYNVEPMADGTLLVVEYHNNRLQRFTRAGESLGTWGHAGRNPGELAYPWAVVIGRRERIFVIDSGNNRVQAISVERLRPRVKG